MKTTTKEVLFLITVILLVISVIGNIYQIDITRFAVQRTTDYYETLDKIENKYFEDGVIKFEGNKIRIIGGFYSDETQTIVVFTRDKKIKEVFMNLYHEGCHKIEGELTNKQWEQYVDIYLESPDRFDDEKITEDFAISCATYLQEGSTTSRRRNNFMEKYVSGLI